MNRRFLSPAGLLFLCALIALDATTAEAANKPSPLRVELPQLPPSDTPPKKEVPIA